MSYMRGAVRSILPLIAAFMGGMAGSSQASRQITDKELIRRIHSEESTRQDRIDRIHLRKGCRRFSYPDGFTCIALNKKNADRKHRNYENLHQQTNNP